MHDIIVIGAGVSGLAAGMYSARFGMKCLVIGDNIGGTITLTDVVENYPGFKSISGYDLAEAIREHAESYGVEILEEKVKNVEKCNGIFKVYADKTYKAKAVIFATGTRRRKLNVKGAEEFENKGLHYCALCDGPLYKNKVVAVVGGSDSTAKEALLLANYASKVYIIYRGEKLRAEPINKKRVEENEKIKVLRKTNIVELLGDDKLNKVVLDRKYKGSNVLKVDALFVAIGGVPNSELARKLGVKTNEKGEIIVDREAKTNIKGVFACGDVTDSKFKQAITGVAEAVVASYSAYRYISSEFVYTCIDEEYC